MKTRVWILLLAGVFLALAGILVIQKLTAKPAAVAEVFVDGALVRTIDLQTDGVYRIESDRGWNELTVRDGKIAVTAASCPGGDCLKFGWQNSGAPITCLPNRMTIRFTAEAALDGIVR